MKKLYLVTGAVVTREYMGSSQSQTVQRIVWAETSEEAEDLFTSALTREDTYGSDVSVLWCSATEALGTP